MGALSFFVALAGKIVGVLPASPATSVQLAAIVVVLLLASLFDPM